MEIERSILIENDILLCRGINRFLLSEGEQRVLLAWFMKNTPSLVLGAVCSECKEMLEYNNFCENKAERGK